MIRILNLWIFVGRVWISLSGFVRELWKIVMTRMNLGFLLRDLLLSANVWDWLGKRLFSNSLWILNSRQKGVWRCTS